MGRLNDLMSFFQGEMGMFSLLILVLWGLFWGWVAKKLAQWADFNESWQRICFWSGFITMGLAIFVILGRLAYKKIPAFQRLIDSVFGNARKDNGTSE